jgi:hypothetical protein
MPFRPVRQGNKFPLFLLTTFHHLKNCYVDDLIFYAKKKSPPPSISMQFYNHFLVGIFLLKLLKMKLV